MSIQDEIKNRKKQLEVESKQRDIARQNRINDTRKIIPFVAEMIMQYAINWAARTIDKKVGIVVQGVEVARRHWFGKKYLKFTYRINEDEQYYIELHRYHELFPQLTAELYKKGLKNVYIRDNAYYPGILIFAELDME